MTLTLVISAMSFVPVYPETHSIRPRIPTFVQTDPRYHLRRSHILREDLYCPANITFKPWLLSNIVDTATSAIPEHLLEFVVLERAGLKLGVIGLVEKYEL